MRHGTKLLPLKEERPAAGLLGAPTTEPANSKSSSKSLGGFAGGRVGSLPARLGVGGGEIGPELNLGDIGDAGPGQPVTEIGAWKSVPNAAGRSVP